MNARVLAVSWLSVVTGIAAAGCSQELPVPPLSPNTPLPATLNSISVTGPETVAPGQKVQYHAIGNFFDRSTKDISELATWISTAPRVLQIDSSGAAVAGEPGSGELLVRYQHYSHGFSFIVTDDGTFRLAGTAFGATGLNNLSARVVLEGANLRQETSVDPGEWTYAFYGVSGPVHLTILADGFVSQSVDLTVSRHTRQDFFLSRATREP